MQLELPGRLAPADGRYLARDADGTQRVLVLDTLGAPLPPGRRRRRPRPAEAGTGPAALPLARVTAVRAFAPFDSAAAAEDWLAATSGDERAVGALVGEAVRLLNRALHAQGAAGADPYVAERTAEQAVRVRLGYGSGEELAAGRFTVARDVDVWASGSSGRRRREEELRPQERVAAVLGGRERIDACETLLLRARADLDAGRSREAALQLQIGLEALLAELRGALADPAHEADMAELETRRGEAGAAGRTALGGDLDIEHARSVGDLLSICERVLRRRRLLRG